MPGDNLKLADKFANDYDEAVLKNSWNGPEVIYRLVKKEVKANSNILDLGIGTGESSRRFENDGHFVTGIDGSEKMLEVCQKKGIGKKQVKHNLENPPYPFKKGEFDVVISNGVFHLLNPIRPIFKEVKRILKPGEIFVFTFDTAADVSDYTKISPGIWERKTESGVLVYKYNADFIDSLLSENAFELLSGKSFLAYKNSQLQKDFYFTAKLARLK